MKPNIKYAAKYGFTTEIKVTAIRKMLILCLTSLTAIRISMKCKKIVIFPLTSDLAKKSLKNNKEDINAKYNIKTDFISHK